MKFTVYSLCLLCAITGLALCSLVRRYYFLDCRTLEIRHETCFGFRDSGRFQRKDGWMFRGMSHPYLGILDRLRGCHGYYEANGYRACANYLIAYEEETWPREPPGRALRTLSQLALEESAIATENSSYYSALTEDPDGWYKSLFVLSHDVREVREGDGTSAAVWLLENHSGTNQTILSADLDSLPGNPELSWTPDGAEAWAPVDFPFEFPSNGEFPGVRLRFRLRFDRPNSADADHRNIRLSIAGRKDSLVLGIDRADR